MAATMTARLWGLTALSLLAGGGSGFLGVAVYMHVPPLTTHALTAPLNGAATAAPVTLQGLSDLPKLVSGEMTVNRWEVAGGALLQAGLYGPSISALRRAIAHDQENAALHVALGEAMVLSNDGVVTDSAKAEFEFALRADINDLIPRFYMAYWLLQNGKPKPALVKWVGLMRTVGDDPVWYARLWSAMPLAAEQAGVSRLALEALCTASM